MTLLFWRDLEPPVSGFDFPNAHMILIERQRRGCQILYQKARYYCRLMTCITAFFTNPTQPPIKTRTGTSHFRLWEVRLSAGSGNLNYKD
jgi:hypothetical protein